MEIICRSNGPITKMIWTKAGPVVKQLNMSTLIIFYWPCIAEFSPLVVLGPFACLRFRLMGLWTFSYERQSFKHESRLFQRALLFHVSSPGALFLSTVHTTTSPATPTPACLHSHLQMLKVSIPTFIRYCLFSFRNITVFLQSLRHVS